MFAKLKKKVLEEGGADGDRGGGLLPGPGLASPVRKDTPGSPFDSRRQSLDSPARVSSPNSSILDDSKIKDGSKEEVMALLVKRSEQVKKLEGKVTDLAAMIKEKNRALDKLESALEKQQDLTSQKLHDLNEQYQATRAKMTEGFTLALQKKDEEMQEKIKAIEKSKGELEKKLSDAKQYRDKLHKREEESDELQGLASQELAKVKHLLLNTQAELKKKSEQLSQSERKVSDLESEIHSLMSQIGSLTSKSETVEEQNTQYQAELHVLRSENDSLTFKLKEAESQVSQKVGQLHSLQGNHSLLNDKYMTIQKSAELHKHKMTTLLEEKDEHITRLQERVITLEQRVKDSCLTEDERVKAIEQERTTLEKKLEEARQQLLQVKTSWSDKISHLEQQIGNLNTKIAEDNEELINKEKEAEASRAVLHRQIEDLKSKLDSAEILASQNLELAKDKDRLLDKQKLTMESELLRSKQVSDELEADLKAHINSLEAQVHKLEKARDHERDAAQKKIEQLEHSQDDWLEKEIDSEKQITNLEDELQRAKVEKSQKEKDNSQLSKQLNKKVTEAQQLQEKVAGMEKEVQSLRTEVKELQHTLKSARHELQQCSNEKDAALLRNAELSQQCESLKKSSNEDRRELETELNQKNSAISGLEQSLEDMQSELHQHQDKVRQLEEERVSAQGEYESSQIKQLKQDLCNIEDQVAEKNKTIRVQQQRLTDLKKTLQRELKVQHLPNDEATDGNLSDSSVGLRTSHQQPKLIPSPQPSRKEILTKNSSTPVNQAPIVPSRYTDRHYSLGAGSKSVMGSFDRTICVTSDDGVVHDINFEYLKHVVLKFMLSRESEAIHLIKAVSMLLRFSRDEQKLIKDTLEYRMSWFGHKPRLGKGQTAKVIPPSY